jgi:hypothetical protein
MDTPEQILTSISPITLREMDSVSLLDRTDVKYAISAQLLPSLLRQISDDYRVLEIESRRMSSYRTLYFDTPDLQCYLQHHNGKRNRQKFRIRQYNTTGACFLEVKAKNNKGRTHKQRIAIDGIEQALSGHSQAFIESVVGSSPPLAPRLWSTFSRITLVAKDQPERATIDLDLSFEFGEGQQKFPDIAIVEVKQERDVRHSIIREALSSLHVRPLRVSKYCLGMILLNPTLKANRFKQKLRAISRPI